MCKNYTLPRYVSKMGTTGYVAVVVLQTRNLNGNFVNEPMPKSIMQFSFQTYSKAVKQAELASSTHGGGTQQ